MSDMREEMLRTLDRIVEDTVTPQVRESLDMRTADASPNLPAPYAGALSDLPLWQALEEAGITALGGTGADDDVSFADAMALVQRAAFHALPVPLAETITARRIARRYGLQDDDADAITLVPSGGGENDVSASAVPWARGVKLALRAAGAGKDGRIELVDVSSAVGGQGANIAGEPRDRVDPNRARVLAGVSVSDASRAFEEEGALLRAVQLSGAAAAALDHCLRWVSERIQFGKPIAKHQAIQQLMAQIASEVAAAQAAVDLAVEASEQEPSRFEIAVAKARAGEAAGKIATISHAVFGAMGFTREHPLHYATRRLWSWRNEFGSEVYWQTDIGRLVIERGGKALWATLTARET
jgi:acyl-CoA dehydrogenase